jgi:hypothetical protein
MSLLVMEPSPSQIEGQNPSPQDFSYEYFSRLNSHEMIVCALHTFCPHGLVEIRCLGVGGKSNRNDSGYFNNFQIAAKAVQPYLNDGATRGVYFVLNPFLPELLARASNRFERGARTTTSDAEITSRKWLFIDCDPVRPAGISSTAAQVQQSRLHAIKVAEWLMREGFAKPVLAMSGNGHHLHFPISLPNNVESLALVSGVLRTLHSKFSDGFVKIDTSVGNAARVCRLYGTIARKGDQAPDKPHRSAYLDYVPGSVAYNSGEFCNPEALRAVAAMSETEDSVSNTASSSSSARISRRLIVSDYLRDRNVQFTEKPETDGWTRYVLAECPFDSTHKSPDAMVTQHRNGGTQFKCFHNSCSQYDWQHFKEQVGEPLPEHYDSPQSSAARTFTGKSAAELWSLADQPVAWLVDNVFSCDQPTIFGAKQKSLKTTLLTDLAVSLSSGLPWLGRFNVPQKRRVLFVTGEATEAAAIRKVRRAAQCRNLCQDDFTNNLRIEARRFPTLPSLADCMAVASAVKEHNIEVVILDPLYMGLQGLNTANLTEVGPAMRQFMEHCRPAGLIIAHHVKKSASYDDAPNLEDLSQAGIAEFAGNYWLMGRMNEYTGDGLHQLAVRYGGRDEQFGLLKLDFDERNWIANFSDLLEHRKTTQSAKEVGRVEQQMTSIRGYLTRNGGVATLAELAESLGTKHGREPFRQLIDQLCNSGQYERCKTKGGNNRQCDGLKVKGQ